MNTPGYTVTQFANDVLAGIGAPQTEKNRAVIYAWVRAEGTSAQFNPLASSQPSYGASDFNSIGVKNYPTYSQGVTATVQTLTNGYYNGIVNDFRKGNVDPYQIVKDNADEFSIWASGPHGQYNATYVNNIAANVGGPPPGNVSVFQVGKNFNQGASDIKNAALSPFKDAAKYIAYSAAFLAAILLVLAGIALIGADIGLSVFARSRTAKNGQRVLDAIGTPKRRRVEREKQARVSERAATIERRAQEKHEADIKLRQARATEVRTRQRHRAATASASKKEVAKREQTAYNRGAEDVLKTQASISGRKRAR